MNSLINIEESFRWGGLAIDARVLHSRLCLVQSFDEFLDNACHNYPALLYHVVRVVNEPDDTVDYVFSTRLAMRICFALNTPISESVGMEIYKSEIEFYRHFAEYMFTFSILHDEGWNMEVSHE